MSDDIEMDLDDLIDVLPDDEIDLLLKDLDLGDFDNEKTEDADLIKKDNSSDRVDPAKSRDAKQRYNKNRNTYRKAFDKFRRSSRGKLFYKKLSRFNKKPSTIMRKDTEQVESMIDKVLLGKSIDSILKNSFTESKPIPDKPFTMHLVAIGDQKEMDVQVIPNITYTIKGGGKTSTITKDELQSHINSGWYTIK